MKKKHVNSSRANTEEMNFNRLKFTHESCAKMSHENHLLDLINVRDFQKLRVGEWFRLFQLMGSLLPEQVLRDFYHRILELPQKDQGKILNKGFRRMISLTAQKQEERLNEISPAPQTSWKDNWLL